MHRIKRFTGGLVVLSGILVFLLIREVVKRRYHTLEADHETKRIQDRYDRVAKQYDTIIRLPERLLFSDGRQWVTSQAQGEVLEIAVGTGRNFSYYPTGIRLTGVDVSPIMLEIAARRSDKLDRFVDLRQGDAQALEFPDEHFDTVVFTLALCSIPNDQKALEEAKRVLRPGGRLLLLEHVQSPLEPVRVAQRILDPFTVRFGGDHLLREPLNHVTALGFQIEACERSKLGIVERMSARKPE